MIPFSFAHYATSLGRLWPNEHPSAVRSGTHWAIWLSVILVLAQRPLSAQASDEQRAYESQQLQRTSASKADWQKVIGSTSFSEIPEKKEPVEAKKPDRPNFTPPSPPSKVLMSILYIVAAVILIVFLAYIITGGFKNISPSNNTKIKVTEENIEENLMEANPEDFLPPAIERNDYRQAIRLRYLSIIKRLAETERIRWRKEKTNNNYIAEMANSPLREEFMKVTRIYERIWFGDWAEPYAEHDFELHGTSFDELLRGIG